AGEPLLHHAAVCGAPVARQVVTVVADFVVAAQDKPVSASRMARTELAVGLDLAIGVASVAGQLVAVVAGLGAFDDLVAADGAVTWRSRRAARPTWLELAGGGAPVGPGGVAVVAFLVADAQAVAALGGLAPHPGGEAAVARLELAVGAASVAGPGVGVVAR